VTTSTDTRGSRRVILTFFCLAVTIAGAMFTYKLFAFLKTIRRDELAGFAFDPIVIYGIVAMGFLCLLAWAFLTGQFKDIERPKYEMMERFEEQEKAERNALARQSR
jgi:nitrogen fixation-related uncharacterized protein